MDAWIFLEVEIFTIKEAKAALESSGISYKLYDDGDFAYYNRQSRSDQNDDLDNEDHWSYMDVIVEKDNEGVFCGYFFEHSGDSNEANIIWALLQHLPNSHYGNPYVGHDYGFRVGIQASFDGVIQKLIASGALDEVDIANQTTVYLAKNADDIDSMVDERIG